MKSNLISKILGIGVAASTVIALGGAVLTAAPVAADTTKWSSIDTPSMKDGVILPGSDILDYAVSGTDGNTIYVIAEVDRICADDNPFLAEIEAEDNSPEGVNFTYGLFKSTDGGVTWTDITQNVIDTDNLPNFDDDDVANEPEDILSLNYVAVAPDDPDWVAVTGYGNFDTDTDVPPNVDPPFTVASKNGGDDFAYTGEMQDDDNNTSMDIVYDTEVSPETSDGLHLVAAMGSVVAPYSIVDNPGFPQTMPIADTGSVFILNAGTWLTGGWEDASFYDGWDGAEEGNNNLPAKDDIRSWAEVDGAFSPNFADDAALVVIGVAQALDDDGDPIGEPSPYVQTGDMSAKSWGEDASYPDPIEIDADGDDLETLPGIWNMGIALPADYDATDTGARIVFGYADAEDLVTEELGGFVFRIDNDDVSPQVAPSDDPLLASIAVSGDADTGKMMIGEYIQFDENAFSDDGDIVPLDAVDCAGVRVWHTEELDICCPKWELCCTFKCPLGTYAARVAYVPDGTKAYATTTSSDADHNIEGENARTHEDWGTPGDETAFSVSLDNGTSWNQLSLIDTTIDRLSDQVICPDCSVMYLSTINDGDGPDYACEDFDCDLTGDWQFHCDSVWRSFDNGKTWQRVFHGDWADSEGSDEEDPDVTGELLLRLPCSDTENCCDMTDPAAPGGTVYLGLQNTNDMFYSRDCGQCWTETPETKIDIQDFAVDTESTVYVLDIDGNVSKSTNFGRRWSDSIDTGIDSGHMIAVCCAQGLVLVGGFGEDPVAWSDDGGDTWNKTDDVPVDGDVHVACATTCDNIIYIAVDGTSESEEDNSQISGEEDTLMSASDAGIFRGDLTDGSWTDMNAPNGVDYTGIAVGKSDGTLYVSTNFIAVNDNENNSDFFNSDGKWTPCSRTFAEEAESDISESKTEPAGTYVVSAVLRDLDPCSTECCGAETWDVLICGLDEKCSQVGENSETHFDCSECTGQDFDAQVNAIDICGCLTATTNTKIYAIDSREYDPRNGDEGTIWTYEDCASKIGPTLVSPADGSVINCMGCEGCGAGNFNLKWNRMCNACSYDIEIMDDQGNVVVDIDDTLVNGTSCNFFFNAADIFNGENSPLVCGNSYTWHVREANTDCECIHSRWSDTWAFTVATSTANGVKLISPAQAATDIGTTNVGFSWTSVNDATSYTFVLSPNANLASALVSQEISTTAYNYAGPLDNSKTYYWQVKAWKGTTLLSTSDIGVFTIMAAPVAPQPPVVVQQNPAPVINIPPATQITPTWIYAIIGIGAALAVVVIVLIVRTRRP